MPPVTVEIEIQPYGPKESDESPSVYLVRCAEALFAAHGYQCQLLIGPPAVRQLQINIPDNDATGGKRPVMVTAPQVVLDADGTLEVMDDTAAAITNIPPGNRTGRGQLMDTCPPPDYVAATEWCENPGVSTSGVERANVDTCKVNQANNEEYWRATNQVLEVVGEAATSQAPIPTGLLDPLFDLRPGLLIRVNNNLATAAFVHIAEHLSFNVKDFRMVQVLLEPLAHFNIVPAAQAAPEDTVRGIAATLQTWPEGTINDAVVPGYIEGSAAPTANVLNGAMPRTYGTTVEVRHSRDERHGCSGASKSGARRD